MCGIGGYLKSFKKDNVKDHIQGLQQCLSHRGPDGNGVFENDKIVLVHTRLSIIDLSENGNQPIYNEDKKIALICNGEIYNFLEIRKKLIEKGHHFKSTSDSEVIVHLYEETGRDIYKTLNRLRGMFAFAIWDGYDGKLIITRDRVGIKPLYYALNGNSLAFCSEVNPLVKANLVSSKIDQTSLYEFLMIGSIPEPNTFFEEIKALPPGHYLEYENDKISIKQYWKLPSKLDRSLRLLDDVVDKTDFLLQEIIKEHLIADVPVGCFLSAGIDSSLISYYAAQVNEGIFTFTASFPGEPEDEAQIANQTANKIGAKFFNYDINTDFFEGFSDHFKNMDQPFGVSSALSLSRISRLAKKKVKVVLSGDGADEIFGGYSRHQPFFDPPYFKKFPPQMRSVIFSAIGKISGKESFSRTADYLGKSPSQRYLESLQIASSAESLKFIPKDLIGQIDQERYLKKLERIWNDYEDEDVINQMLYLDTQTSLVDEMLVKSDRMTMNQGIEGRVPFLDHRLVEFALSIPSGLKIQNGFGKMPLRKLVEKKLGPALAYREKTGFNSPLKKMLVEDKITFDDFNNKMLVLENQKVIDENTLANLKSSIPQGNFQPSTIFGLYALAQFMDKA